MAVTGKNPRTRKRTVPRRGGQAAGAGKKSRVSPEARRKSRFEKLDVALEKALDDYLNMLGGYKPDRLHRLVLERVEKTLLEYTLKFTGANRSRAAELLGISRSTLLAKMRAHGLDGKKSRATARRRVSRGPS